jgi:hypothetical protein
MPVAALATERLTLPRAEWRGGGDARIIGGRIESHEGESGCYAAIAMPSSLLLLR